MTIPSHAEPGHPMNAEGVARLVDDSRGRPTRTFVRVFVAPEQFDATVASYEQLQQVETDGHFPFPERGLRLAMVGSFLVIAGDDDALEPFRQTVGTLLVDDVEPYYERVVEAGGRVIFPLQDVPTGRAFNAELPDGTIVEFVHHRPV